MNGLNLLLFIILIGIFGFRQPPIKKPHVSINTPLLVHKCTDFEVTGTGDNTAWNKAEWNALNQLDRGVEGYDSRFKVLYSSKGIYVLFDGKDRKITTTYQNDFEDLFNADVFEVFFHPDPAVPLYFEYEINHLNKELVLLVPNLDKRLYGWLPWHYEGERKIRKAVHIEGGKSEAGASITSWRAELFIPFALLAPLSNVPPRSGTVWNANFYRLDYDTGNMIKWAWSPIAQSFHEYKKFGSIQFE
jgi:hypothetical protein